MIPNTKSKSSHIARASISKKTQHVVGKTYLQQQTTPFEKKATKAYTKATLENPIPLPFAEKKKVLDGPHTIL